MIPVSFAALKCPTCSLWIANCLQCVQLAQWWLLAYAVAELLALRWRLFIQGGKALDRFQRPRGFSATWYFRHLIAGLQLVCGNWDCLSKMLSMCLCFTIQSAVVHTHSAWASSDPHEYFCVAQLHVCAEMLIFVLMLKNPAECLSSILQPAWMLMVCVTFNCRV